MTASDEELEWRFRRRFAAEAAKVDAILRTRPTSDDGQGAELLLDPDGPTVLAAKSAEKKNLMLLQAVFSRGLACRVAQRRSEEGREELCALVRAFADSGIRGVLLPGPQRGGDFLNNQLRGAWAEDVVCSLSDDHRGDLCFVRFGPSMAAMPGQQDHAAVVGAFREIMLVEGKRPDLLAFRRKVWAGFTPDELVLAGQWPRRLLGPADEVLIRKAAAAFEVKTSLWHAAKRRLVNAKPLSVTVKVEEVEGFAAWSRATGLPIVFAQVLFDEVYCLSFGRMLRVINEPDKARRFLYQPGDHEVVPQRKSGKDVHHFALYAAHKCAAVAMPNASKAVVEVLPDGSVVPYMELEPARATYTDPSAATREIEFGTGRGADAPASRPTVSRPR